MARVLIAWEFGSGMGHLSQLAGVAEALGRQGHRIVFALHDLQAVSAVGVADRMALMDFTIRQGPHWTAIPGSKAARSPRHSLADALKVYDYQSAARLLATARSWQQLVHQLRPDLIVADFSPTLRLVVADRCPVVIIGNGYSVPPAGRPLPPMRPWEDRLPPASAESEAEIHRAVLTVGRTMGLPAVDHVSDLFSGTRTFICTIPEFDPYAVYRAEPTFNLFSVPVISDVQTIDQRPEDRVFLYMPGRHAALSTVLSAAEALGIQGSAYVPDLPGSLRARFSGPGWFFYGNPPSLAEKLRDARLLIHHGGLLTTYTGLVSGIPQMIMPRFVEHTVTARGAFELGSATVLLGAAATDEATVSGILQSSMRDRALGLRAHATAGLIASRRSVDPLASILAACHDLLAA